MQNLNSSDESQQPSLSLINSEVSSSNRMRSGSSHSASQAPLYEDQSDLLFGLYDFDEIQTRSPTIEEKEREREVLEMKRKERLDFHPSCRIAYNNGDFQTLLDNLKHQCDTNIHFLSPSLFLESYGVISLFAFFTLISQIFPDSMIKNLDKRISRFAQPKPPIPSQVPIPPVTTETVEMIDKFTGTRVFHSRMMSVFDEFLQLLVLNDPDELTAPIISQMLSGILYTNESTLHPSEGKIHVLITETKLEFDLITNKVISWTYTILAVTTS